SAPAAVTVSMVYYTTGGTASPGRDYTELNTTSLTFAPGETTKTVTVNVLGGTVHESNETFNLILYCAANAVSAPFTGTCTTADDDPNGATEVSAPVGGEVRDYTGSGTFTEAVTVPNSLSIRKFSFVSGSGTPWDERAVMEFNVGAAGALPTGSVSLA